MYCHYICACVAVRLFAQQVQFITLACSVCIAKPAIYQTMPICDLYASGDKRLHAHELICNTYIHIYYAFKAAKDI